MTVEFITITTIIILIALFIGFYIFKKQNYNNIGELKSRKTTLMEGVPTQRIETVRNMDISGQSLEYANRLEDDWKRIQSGKSVLVENHLLEAEQATERYRFKVARDYQQKVHSEMESIESDLKKLTSSLDEVIQREDANQRRIDELQAKYKSIREKLHSNSFSYGQAVEALENKLSNMEEEINSFNYLTESGDHEEARKMILKLDEKVKEMNEYMENIPEILGRIEEDFYPQLEEIKYSHEQLIREGYVLPGTPMSNEVENIQESITEIEVIIGELKIDDANKSADNIASKIDELYERMEIEIKAKKDVSVLMNQVRKAIYYLTEEVRVLFFEIDRVSQSYVLVNDEPNKISALKEEVDAIENRFDRLEDNLESGFTSYSEAKKLLTQQQKDLSATNQKKIDVTNQLNNYKKEKEQLKDDLDQMEKTIQDLDKNIDRENLPGVPEEYYEYQQYVHNLLTSLSDELNRPKLKVEKIYDLHNICKEELKKLNERTQKVIDEALLTELIAQRLYRYRDEHPEINQTIKQSERFFNGEFDYESSLQIVRNKLDSIEPGAAEEIEQEYYN